MPKNSALLNEIEAVLKIYFEEDNWLTNDVYKTRLKAIIGEDQYQSSYTKKAQITSYFGFTEWEDFDNPQSRRRITESGKKMYKSIQKDNFELIQETLMESLENVKFGRNNFGCPDSDSDVEPPALFIRAVLDLGYLTYKEFAFLLWKLEDVGGNYTDSLLELKRMRDIGQITLDNNAVKYTDCKPIIILVRWGFLSDENESSGVKRITINPNVLQKYSNRLKNLKIYNVDMNVSIPTTDRVEPNPILNRVETNPIDINRADRLKGGTNILLYGVPGAGKSYTIEKEYCKDEDRIERLVFHPDYTYTDFVGQILPDVSEGLVTYKFNPGPFTQLLKKAYRNPELEYFLVVEELNRGNAQAIFGEIFQLLDRLDDGTSEYGITNSDISKIVYGDAVHKIRIPSNMNILATMNTSDQNVFTMDTAFQRRWDMRMIENDIDKVDTDFANHPILDTTVTWKKFNKIINELIINNNTRIISTEDKRLGSYFIKKNDLIYNKAEKDGLTVTEKLKASHQNKRFPEKVLKYLWDDAFKFNRDDLFDTSKYLSLEDIVRKFETSEGNDRFSVFKDSVLLSLVN
jgi:5-methylcytosine-specific restriction enzyme B